jgi:uncharacterized OsmC-like protein
MKGDDKIRTAFDRATKALRLRDSIGRGTAVTRVTMREGFTCEVEDGRWNLTVDMSEKTGGDGRGPDPGVMGRTALGSCLAIAYRQWLIQCDVPLERLRIEIQADYDVRAEYGVTDGSPAYEEIRYVVTVESDAPEEEIVKALDKAEKHCTYLVIFREPQRVVRELRIAAPADPGR